MELHTRGVLHVIVVESSRLEVHSQAEGFDSHVKPFVVLETVPLQSLSTKAISYFQTKTKNPLQILPDGFHPVWKEEHFLKVQELDQVHIIYNSKVKGCKEFESGTFGRSL